MAVKGPLALTHNLDETREIGRGAQFVVYHNSVSGSGATARWDIQDFAVKTSHFTLQPGQRLDLAAPAFETSGVRNVPRSSCAAERTPQDPPQCRQSTGMGT
jgi:hypothetical protein